MSYIPNPGSGSLLKNSRKTGKQPDWRGDFVAPDGSRFNIVAWEEQTKTGIPKLSVKVEPYTERQAPENGAAAPTQPQPAKAAFDDEIPF